MTTVRALFIVLCSVIALTIAVLYSHKLQPMPCTDKGGAFLSTLHGQHPCPAASAASNAKVTG